MQFSIHKTYQTSGHCVVIAQGFPHTCGISVKRDKRDKGDRRDKRNRKDKENRIEKRDRTREGRPET